MLSLTFCVTFFFLFLSFHPAIHFRLPFDFASLAFHSAVDNMAAPVPNSDYLRRREEHLRARTRDRERYHEETNHDNIDIRNSRPDYLRDDYGTSGSGPLVLRDMAQRRRNRTPTPPRIRDFGVVSHDRETMIERPVITRITNSPSPPPAQARIAARTRPTHVPERRHVDDVVWDLSRTKDTTVHLELDVTEDLELALEEFNRLSRHGNFRAAKQLFGENLKHQMDNPYVIVQYAWMLLTMGDYKAAQALESPYSLKESSELLRTNWNLLQLITALQTGGITEQALQHAENDILPLEFLKRREDLGSTQV